MSLIGAILNAAPAPTKTPVPLASRVHSGGLLSGLMRQTGVTQQLTSMEASGTVFNIVDRIANAVSQVEWHLYRKAESGKLEDREEVTSHLALDILNRPNQFTTRQELFEAAQQHQELTGEGWLAVGRNERARSIPLELWVIRPDRMEPIPSYEHFLAGYVYHSPDGEQVPLRLDDMLFMRRPDPGNAYRGLGPIKPILVDIDSGRAAAEWNRNFFRNSAEPGGIIEVEKRLSDDEFDEMVQRWREQHQGVNNAHNVAMLENGAKWVDRKLTQRDMQFVELRGVTASAIREAFGFPKFMAGLVDDVNRANAEASEAMFAQWIVVPRLQRWKGMLNSEFLPLFGGTAEGLEFDFDNPVPENSEAENAARTSKTTAVATLVPLGFDAVDAMEKFGLPAIKWSKPEPPAPPAGLPAGGPKPSDEVMAYAARMLNLDMPVVLDHKPGGKDHNQKAHARTRARLAAADERLLADRLSWVVLGAQLTPEQRLAEARRVADGDGPEAAQARAQLAQARFNLQRDRARVLAKAEQTALIDGWIDDHPSGMRSSFELARQIGKVGDDPRLDALGDALDSGDRPRVIRVLKRVADDAGVRRIGGDMRRGPDQLLPFDPREHRSISGPLRTGQKVLVVTPGYAADDLVLEHAAVQEAFPDDIARIQGALAVGWPQNHPGKPPHRQESHGRRYPGGKRAFEEAQELEGLKESLSRVKRRAAEPPTTPATSTYTRPTSTPTRMTKGQYTKLLKDENIRLHILDGKTEKEGKALARPAATIDELKARNTELRRALRGKGVDYRTDEQRRTDDAEKNALLDEVQRLAVAGGHDGAAKRDGAAKMTVPELKKFIADVKNYQSRQVERARAAQEGAAAQREFERRQATLTATDRQVDYILNLLSRRRRSGEGGGFFSGPTDRAGIAKLSRADASAYIDSLRGDY